jgi:RNA polymerase sigma-54 factor
MADMKQQIKQRQSQSLHMTSQLRSAIKMLEIPSPELHNYLSLLCLDNPLLSVESPEESIASYDLDQYDMDDYNESADFQDGWHPIKSDDLNANSLSDNKNHIKTLRQHVCEFIELNVTNTVEKIIAYFLLDNLDSNGYLKVDLESIEKTIGSDDNMAARVLHMMQAICKRSLRMFAIAILGFWMGA